MKFQGPRIKLYWNKAIFFVSLLSGCFYITKAEWSSHHRDCIAFCVSWLHCHKRVLTIGWLKWILSQFWNAEVCDGDVGRVDSF